MLRGTTDFWDEAGDRSHRSEHKSCAICGEPIANKSRHCRACASRNWQGWKTFKKQILALAATWEAEAYVMNSGPRPICPECGATMKWWRRDGEWFWVCPMVWFEDRKVMRCRGTISQ
jgi:hypothetical protein